MLEAGRRLAPARNARQVIVRAGARSAEAVSHNPHFTARYLYRTCGNQRPISGNT